MNRIAIALVFLISSCTGVAQKNQTAQQLVTAAQQKAAKENKNVFVIFHASWCGWCHKMDSSMNDVTTKKSFDDNFVTVHVTIQESAKNKTLETPGGDALSKKYHGEKAGLPFWFVLDKDGNLLADSFMKPANATTDTPGDNMGCPAAENEVEAFVKVLKRTSRLNDAELVIITERFRKNEQH